MGPRNCLQTLVDYFVILYWVALVDAADALERRRVAAVNRELRKHQDGD